MSNKNISIIIPIHTWDENISTLFFNALSSITIECPIIVSVNKELTHIENTLKVNENVDVNFVNGSNFSQLVNEGVKKVKTEYFTILEFDDEYTNLWFEEVQKYISEKPEVSVFLPLTEIVDFNEKKFLSYGNEAPWASSFSEEIGYIDKDSLQQFFDFYLTGSVFNTKDWNFIGGLKASFKLTFWYEFLLRLTHNDKKAFVIPKLGYKHYVNRANSLYDLYQTEMDREESQWWYELALKEYAYKKDRNIKYEK
jgi:hypothetical protein